MILPLRSNSQMMKNTPGRHRRQSLWIVLMLIFMLASCSPRAEKNTYSPLVNKPDDMKNAYQCLSDHGWRVQYGIYGSL